MAARDAVRAVAMVAGMATACCSAGAQIAADEVAFRARLAADYLVSVQLPSGLFAYEYDFLAARLVEADSIVRQAGTAFGVALFLNRWDAPGYRPYAERALRALVAYSMPYDDGIVVATGDDLADAPAGATALALLAELNYVEATGNNGFAEARAAWARALASLQRPDGGFASTPASDTRSPYYDGETWLAFAHLRRLFPEDAVADEVLAKADEGLMRAYGDAPDTAFFQWGLMAAAVRYETTGDERFRDFIARQSEAFLTDLRPRVSPANNGCAVVEGLAAASSLLVASGPDDLRQRIATRIDAELTKSLAFQIMPGQGQISLGDQRYLVDPEIARFAGAVLNGRYQSRTRIDSTVHCLSALTMYASMRRALTR